MGFSVVIAYIILSISFLIVFATVLDSYMNILNLNYILASEEEDESFTILDCYNITPCSPCNFSVILKNTGSKTIDLNYLTVVFDGLIYNYVKNSTYLFPLENESIIVMNVTPSNLRLRIVTKTGSSAFSNCRIS